MRKEIYPMDYEQYIKACQTIQKTNNLLLQLFEEDLVKSGLKEKTIRRHLSNVDFFLNEFLIRAGALPMEEGISMLDEYLGNFFIRKCMWSTPANALHTHNPAFDKQALPFPYLRFLCSNILFHQEISQSFLLPEHLQHKHD